MAESRPCWVYRLFAADGELVYVGKSFTPQERIDRHRKGVEHSRSKEWMTRVVRSELTRYDSETLAKKAEAEIIAAERPTENRFVPSHPEERRRRNGQKPSALKVRCTDRELKRWHAQAENAGLTLSDYVRSLMASAPQRAAA